MLHWSQLGELITCCAGLRLAELSECHILVSRKDARPVGLALAVPQEYPKAHFAGAAGRGLPLVRLPLRGVFGLGFAVALLASTSPSSPDASAPRIRSSATSSIAASDDAPAR